MSHHTCFSRRSFKIEIFGRIAHVSGKIGSREDHLLLRKIISRIKGIHSIWDPLTVAETPPLVLDLGCGRHKQFECSIGVDKYKCNGVDVVCDMESALPFRNDSADHIFTVHVLEHIHELPRLMNEIHRILKPGGILHLMVPHRNSDNAVADPTHVRFFNLKTIAFFCRNNSGIMPFNPLCVSRDLATIYADLTPAKAGLPVLAEEDLSYYFE
jgi:SAM-dependent methyltransferase